MRDFLFTFRLHFITYHFIYIYCSFLLFPPPLSLARSLPLSLTKCVEEHGVNPFLFNQKIEGLFWLLSPLAPAVLASVSSTPITFSTNYSSWWTCSRKFSSPQKGTVMSFFFLLKSTHKSNPQGIDLWLKVKQTYAIFELLCFLFFFLLDIHMPQIQLLLTQITWFAQHGIFLLFCLVSFL